MKSIYKFILVAAVVVCLPGMVFAQFATPTDGFNNNGTRAAQFLKLAVGGRAAAMGESYAAIANDASALFWNPGGIGNLQNFEAHLTHVEYLQDFTFDYIGIVIPTNAGNLGFSAGALGMGETNVTTLADPDGELGTTWSASSIALGITFARALSNRFSVGVTGKYIRESIFNSSATSLAIDIGSIYDTGIKGIKIGMAMTNFGGKMQLSGRDFIVRDVDVEPTLGGNVTPPGELDRSEWPLPLMFRVGLSLEVMKNESGTLLIASDFTHPTDADERINVGAEYAFSNKIFLRGGYKFNYEEESFTFGGGLNLPITNYNLMIDYAYQQFGLLGETHRFSLGFRL
jgi:hypothetical protein